ncbi:IS66 family insertion sequence element accessory protein TnpB [Vibrio navarrensis]|uniref:IS66 family insertion sequence element accessory protein TnpB n=2 Tax=Vibrio TaxID=662 RepID=UPI001D0369EE|nr:MULTISPECIES: IS66 family insertion sequence element accessory protein TnpB [Vibrio]
MLSAPEIYLYRESVDFRKSINGLAAIIENDTDLPLGSGALFFSKFLKKVISSRLVACSL